jgi:hypothetical protein
LESLQCQYVMSVISKAIIAGCGVDYLFLEKYCITNVLDIQWNDIILGMTESRISSKYDDEDTNIP